MGAVALMLPPFATYLSTMLQLAYAGDTGGGVRVLIRTLPYRLPAVFGDQAPMTRISRWGLCRSRLFPPLLRDCRASRASRCALLHSRLRAYRALRAAGGNFYVALELLSSSHVETRVSAIKLLSLMLVSSTLFAVGNWFAAAAK